MLKNYFKVAWRHIVKSPFHSTVNVAGLAIGIGFVLLVGAYVWSERRVNSTLRNADRQYIIQSNWKDPNMGLDLTTVGPLAKALKEQYPQLVANYYRWDGITSTASKGDKIFREGLQIGDSTLLTMFGFRLLQGNAKTALNDPFSVVITEDRAVKYFGRKDVLGETLTLESFSGSKHDFKITGVMKMPGDNSVIHLTPENDNQFYIPAASINYFGRTLEAWADPYRVAYVELQPNVSPQALQKPMQDLLNNNAPPQIADGMRPFLAPLKDYYLNQNNGLVKKMLWVVSVVALFILLMAVVNFINLSIGQSSARLKEIGLRKVMGGRQRQLVQQFLAEAVLLALLSTLVALGIYAGGRSALSGVLGGPLPRFSEFPLPFAGLPFLIAITVGLIAGWYPAFMLARMKATDSVKGKLNSVKANIFLRKALVGFQAFVAAIVFAGAFITVQQVSLFFSKNLGYDKDYVLSVQTPRDWSAKGVQGMTTVRYEMEKLQQISKASLSWSVPNGMSSGSNFVYAEGKDSTQAAALEVIMTDEAYLDVFKIPLQAGRFFRRSSDTLNVVMNTAATKALGFKTAGEAVGKRVFIGRPLPVTVIGVVSDFHFGSMKTAVKPLLITHVGLANIYRLLCVRLRPGNVAEGLETIRKKWVALLPGSAFEYTFMDDALKRLYAAEIQLKKAVQVALVLALVIVLLGISGLVSLTVQKRTKEIGIRKIVGASAANVVHIFLKDFLPVVLIGGLLSVPVVWLIMQGWLNDYAYRISLTPLPFLVSIGVISLVASGLIVLQIARIAAENPVKSLRTE